MRVLARLALAAAGLVLVARLVVAVTTATTSEVVPAPGGVFVEGLAGQPGWLSPLLAPGNPCDRDIGALVFSGLTKRDENGGISPDLATSWQISADTRTYTFTLRIDARWHDGAPVTADDVVYTVAALQSSTPGATPWLASLWRGVSAEKLSTHSVRLTLPAPYAPFMEYTTVGLLPAHILQGTGDDGLDRYNARPIGTGPYLVSERNRLHTVLTAFDAYPAPMIPRLEFVYYPDHTTALRALAAGQVNAVAGVTPADVPSLAGHSITTYWAPRASQAMVYFNLSLPFFEDAATRRALAAAIDRTALVNTALAGRARPATSIYLSTSWAATPTPAATSGLTASAMLDAAGWIDTDRDGVRERHGVKLEFGLLTPSDATHVEIATAIARAWTALGAAVDVQMTDAQTLSTDYIQPRRFEALLVEWADLPQDPDPYEFWHSSQAAGPGLNLSGFASQTADEIMEQARQTGDQAQRKALYARVQAIIADLVPAVPLYEPFFGYAVSDSVKQVRLGFISEPADRFRYSGEWYLQTRTITTIEQRRVR